MLDITSYTPARVAPSTPIRKITGQTIVAALSPPQNNYREIPIMPTKPAWAENVDVDRVLREVGGRTITCCGSSNAVRNTRTRRSTRHFMTASRSWK